MKSLDAKCIMIRSADNGTTNDSKSNRNLIYNPIEMGIIMFNNNNNNKGNQLIMKNSAYLIHKCAKLMPDIYTQRPMSNIFIIITFGILLSLLRYSYVIALLLL